MGKILYTQIDIVLTGKKIHSVMNEKGYSVKELQETLNLSCPQPVYRWIRGYTLPSVDNLYRLHKIFGVHMEDMIIEAATGKN